MSVTHDVFKGVAERTVADVVQQGRQQGNALAVLPTIYRDVIPDPSLDDPTVDEVDEPARQMIGADTV